jgi:hypothetical protein
VRLWESGSVVFLRSRGRHEGFVGSLRSGPVLAVLLRLPYARGVVAFGAAVAGLTGSASAYDVRFPAVGPAFAGHSVVWGEQRASGELSVFERRPERSMVRLYHASAPSDRNVEQSFLGLPGTLSASAHWIGFGLSRDQCTTDGDSVACEANARAIGSRNGGAFHSLLPHCGPAAYITTSAYGDALAVAQSEASCDGQRATRVWLLQGGSAPVDAVRLDQGRVVDQVVTAGHWIAWLIDHDDIRIARLNGSAVTAQRSVAGLPRRGGVMRIALDASGRLAAASSGQTGTTIWQAPPGGTPQRVTQRATGDTLALEDRRLVYELQRNRTHSDLILSTLSGHRLRTIDRLATTNRVIVGDVTLGRDRVTWATAASRDPGSAGAIHVATLR